MHYNNVLNVEQISLSGINMGYSKLKSGFNRGYQLYSGEISGKDRFDLNMTQTGSGFFNQDIYLLLSKAQEGKNSSIILADAEQFQQENDGESVLVITHDYWATPEHRELSSAKDVYALKNFRGADQLRALEVKKFEMLCDEREFKNTMNSLKDSLPNEIGDVWETVVENAANDKIYGEETPQPEKVGSGYKTASSKATKASNTNKNSGTTSGAKTTSSGNNTGSSSGGKLSEELGVSTGNVGAAFDDEPQYKGTLSGGSNNLPTNTTAMLEQMKGQKRNKTKIIKYYDKYF